MMDKIHYNLSNPMERARLINDALKYLTVNNKKVMVFAPAALTYTFNNVVEGIMWMFHHVDSEETFRNVFLTCYLEVPYNGVAFINAITEYGEYKIKPMSIYEYKYVPSEDEYFRNDEKAKLSIMCREFKSNFSTDELERQRINQALEILDQHDAHAIDVSKKIEKFLTKYFQDRWRSYNIEKVNLDPISVQYTLTVYYDADSKVTISI